MKMHKLRTTTFPPSRLHGSSLVFALCALLVPTTQGAKASPVFARTIQFVEGHVVRVEEGDTIRFVVEREVGTIQEVTGSYGRSEPRPFP